MLPDVDAEIGPRTVGALYQNQDGAFAVLSLTRDPAEARALLGRTARWALVVRDVLRPDGQPFAVGSAWTTSDHLVAVPRTSTTTSRKAAA
ncbi:hypothetical protein C6N75_08455 [Streptomyces solincola]|uniref:Uncharacterized protein n=1 Tax=Streptomyces solincola TaxID=2100817 RepID=A0A2S9PZ20_9ACTN|nr:hypothetical protein C6N75_08455 [Streptomyces solincola]